jgi:hypothetical protein
VKVIVAAILLLAFAGTSQAGPKKFFNAIFGSTNPERTWHQVWTDPLVWADIAISIGSDWAATRQAHECRQRQNAGIAFCDGGYGEFKAREIERGVATLGFTTLSVTARKAGFSDWFMPSSLFNGYNITVAYRQSQIGCPAGELPVYGTKYNCQPEYATWGPTAQRLITLRRSH